jgi:fructose-1,6-bisphosphatase/inositol monophosphatase family enzyme
MHDPSALLVAAKELALLVRAAVHGVVAAAAARGETASLAREVAQGAGDTTFAIDACAESTIDAWLEARARCAPLSLLTEDAGWRHRGPDGAGGTRELAGFDHGGPRFVVDPIDGTRNLMADLRSAWCVVAACPPGPSEPRLAQAVAGVVCELPDSRARAGRVLWAVRGEHALLEQRTLADDALEWRRPLRVDGEARVDAGYFPFFRYLPSERVQLARIEAAFFARLARHERAVERRILDDQYISNAGQLALLALGTYRMVCDLRAHLAARDGRETLSSKPYDCAGAIVVAREAGCQVDDAEGGRLDFPLDATTRVSFVGWHNLASKERMGPHLAAALREH